MKTKEDWTEELFGCLSESRCNEIAQIQLDALKEGMRRAAAIADNKQYAIPEQDAPIAILTTAEQLTLSDL